MTRDDGRHEETGHENGARCATMGALAGLLSGACWLGVFAVGGVVGPVTAGVLGAVLCLVAGGAVIVEALAGVPRGDR